MQAGLADVLSEHSAGTVEMVQWGDSLLRCSSYLSDAAPSAYRYPYPDFLQPVYTAEAAVFDPYAREADGYETEARLRPLADVRALTLDAGQLLFYDAALNQRACVRQPSQGTAPC